jgi:uncharacterized protein YfdQ (DUF2303 family)
MLKEPLGEATVDAIAVLAQQALQDGYREVKTDDGRHLLVLPTLYPDGKRAYVTQDITDPLRKPLPPQIRQGLTLQTLDSLVEYAERFKGDNTVLFADIDQNSITAMIDYHAPTGPDHAAHRATLTLPFSFEWQTWKAMDGKLVPHLTFARFLEENAPDIVAPDGGELLEVCRDLQMVRKADFRAVVRTQSGTEKFEFTEDTTTRSGARGQEVEVPTRFQLEIPVYFNDPVTPLFAFLRFEPVGQTQVQFGIALNRAEHVRQARFKMIVLDAAARIGVPAVFGRLAS